MQPLAQRSSHDRIAGVLATLFRLLNAPHRVQRLTGPGFFPNCICRIESTILSVMLPSVVGISAFNFKHCGSVLYSNYKNKKGIFFS